MRHIRTYTALVALAAATALIVSACGGSSDQSAEAPAPAGTSSAQTVSVESVDGVGDVLVDPQGAALYAADQEAGGMIRCTDSCTAIWEPLTLPDGDQPAANGDVGDKLGVVLRPDGAQQITFAGMPLYRFTQDSGPGKVSGDGVVDSFAGTDFTWHVATTSGRSSSTSNSPGSGYGY